LNETPLMHLIAPSQRHVLSIPSLLMVSTKMCVMVGYADL
jgi:hypothetical protein